MFPGEPVMEIEKGVVAGDTQGLVQRDDTVPFEQAAFVILAAGRVFDVFVNQFV